MKRLSYFGCLVLVGFAFVVFDNLSHNDWRACIQDTPAVPLSWRLLVPPGLNTMWVYWMPVIPLLVLSLGTDAPDRKAWAAAIALFGFGLWLMFPGSSQHDCDRKGTDSAFRLILLLPIAFAMTLFVLFTRRGARNTG